MLLCSSCKIYHIIFFYRHFFRRNIIRYVIALSTNSRLLRSSSPKWLLMTEMTVVGIAGPERGEGFGTTNSDMWWCWPGRTFELWRVPFASLVSLFFPQGERLLCSVKCPVTPGAPSLSRNMWQVGVELGIHPQDLGKKGASGPRMCPTTQRSAAILLQYSQNK